MIPWTGVTSGPTGTIPQDFWDWLGSIANTIVNGLLTVGQLLYGGLIAIGTFFAALGEAIVAWGMWLVGTFQAALGQIQGAVQKAGEVLGSFVAWALEFIRTTLQKAVDFILGPILTMLDAWAYNSALSFSRLTEASRKGSVNGEDALLMGKLLEGALPQLIFGLSLAVVSALVLAAFVALATPAGAIAAVVKEVLKDVIKAAVKHWVATTVFLSGIVGWVLSNFPPSDQLAAGTLGAIDIVWSIFMISYASRNDAPILKDVVGLFLTFIGTLIVFKILPLATVVGSRVLVAVIGTALSAGGLLIALDGADIAPGPLGNVDELLSATALGFGLAETAVAVNTCISGNGC